MTPGIARVLLAGPLIGAAALVAPAAGQSADPANGRRLALKICTACHVVAPDQELPPSSRKPAPSFAAIARRPGITAASLQKFIEATHAGIATPANMPNMMLTDDQARDIAAYIFSLRPAKPATGH